MADARSGGGLKEEEEEEIELELDLGLSIGGGFRKPEKSTRVDWSAVFSDLDSDRDALSKERDVHALRRLEARRKRDEKQLKNGAEGGHGDSDGDKVRLEARRARDRVRDREAKENEANLDSVHRECNREGNRDGREETKSVECEELRNNGNRDQCLNPIGYNAFSGQFPVVPVQHSCPIPPQYVSLHNANGFPFLMPCWAPAGANSDNGKNRNSSAVSNGSSRDAETKELASNGSPGHSSSAVSDHRSSSHRGGAGGSSNSDTRSHISNPQPVQTESSARETPTKLEDKASSNQGEPNKEIDKAMDNSTGKKIPTNISQPIPSSPKESLLTPHDLHKPISTDEKNHGNASLVQMPCVSTTGNGPNGKTINGFLYRYSKSEVTIVCVCHGSSFSPAEFVRHAGGTDISHPLRHITMVPSAFGQ